MDILLSCGDIQLFKSNCFIHLSLALAAVDWRCQANSIQMKVFFDGVTRTHGPPPPHPTPPRPQHSRVARWVVRGRASRCPTSHSHTAAVTVLVALNGTATREPRPIGEQPVYCGNIGLLDITIVKLDKFEETTFVTRVRNTIFANSVALFTQC